MTDAVRFDTPCQVLVRRFGGRTACGEPSLYRYEAMAGGFMHLCPTHGRRHARICERADGWIGDIYADVLDARKDPNRIDIPWAGGLGNASEKAAACLRRFNYSDEQVADVFSCSISVARQLSAGRRWSRARIAKLRELLAVRTLPTTVK